MLTYVSFDGPLEQRPEILDAVGVDLAVHVLLRVVNHATNVSLAPLYER